MARPLAAWVKKHREVKGWSAAELAHTLTVAGYPTKEGTIRVWEAPKGRDPKPETVAAMERMFNAVAPVERDHRDEALDRIAAVLETVVDIHAMRQEYLALTAEVTHLAAEVESLRLQVDENTAARVRKRKERA